MEGGLHLSETETQLSEHKHLRGAVSWTATNVYSACFSDKTKILHLAKL